MEHECESCGTAYYVPDYNGGDVAYGCPECDTPYRSQPNPIHSEMEVRNMPAPGEQDMGGNPLQEGILADGGWQNRQKRDESYASVRTADEQYDAITDPNRDIYGDNRQQYEELMAQIQGLDDEAALRHIETAPGFAHHVRDVVKEQVQTKGNANLNVLEPGGGKDVMETGGFQSIMDMHEQTRRNPAGQPKTPENDLDTLLGEQAAKAREFNERVYTHQLNWNPGQNGRGVVIMGGPKGPALHTWPYDPEGDPKDSDFHAQYLDKLGIGTSPMALQNVNLISHIDPDGNMSGHSLPVHTKTKDDGTVVETDLVDHATKIDPRLQNAEDPFANDDFTFSHVDMFDRMEPHLDLWAGVKEAADFDMDDADVIPPGGHSVDVTPHQGTGLHNGTLPHLGHLGVKINGEDPRDEAIKQKYMFYKEPVTLSHEDPNILNVAKDFCEAGMATPAHHQQIFGAHEGVITPSQGLTPNLHKSLGASDAYVEHPNSGEKVFYGGPSTGAFAPYIKPKFNEIKDTIQPGQPLRIAVKDPQLLPHLQQVAETDDHSGLAAALQQRQASIQKEAFLPLLAGGAALGGLIGGATSDWDLGEMAEGAVLGIVPGGAALKGVSMAANAAKAAVAKHGLKGLAKKGLQGYGVHSLLSGAEDMLMGPAAAGGQPPQMNPTTLQQVARTAAPTDWHPSSDPNFHEDAHEIRDGDNSNWGYDPGSEGGGSDAPPTESGDVESLFEQALPKLIHYYFSEESGAHEPEIQALRQALGEPHEPDHDPDPDHNQAKELLQELSQTLIQLGQQEQEQSVLANHSLPPGAGPAAGGGVPNAGHVPQTPGSPASAPGMSQQRDCPSCGITLPPGVQQCPTCAGQQGGAQVPQVPGQAVPNRPVGPLAAAGIGERFDNKLLEWDTALQRKNYERKRQDFPRPGDQVISVDGSRFGPGVIGTVESLGAGEGEPTLRVKTDDGQLLHSTVQDWETRVGKTAQQPIPFTQVQTPQPPPTNPATAPPTMPGTNAPTAKCPHCGAAMGGGGLVCERCGNSLLAQPGPQQPTAKTAHQGPHNAEQFAAVSELLTEQGRAEEIQQMLEHPEMYAEEMAEVSKRITPQEDATQEQVPAEPPMGMAPPGGGMPVPPMSAPPPGGPPGGMMMANKKAQISNNMMSAVEKYATPDSIAPRCPECHSGTTGIVSEEGDCMCHACGNSFKQEVVKEAGGNFHYVSERHDHADLHPNPQGVPAADQEHARDISEEQDSSLSWTDDTGVPLKVGQQYEMHSANYDIPDVIRIEAVKPDAIEYTLVGEYGLEHSTEIERGEAEIERLSFVPLDSVDEELGVEEPEGPDQRVDAGPGEVSDLSQPHERVGAEVNPIVQGLNDAGQKLIDRKNQRVHTFDSTSEAYDETQTNDEIQNGDILHVPNEGVTGFLCDAWPVAVTENSGSFHSVPDLSKLPPEHQEAHRRAVDFHQGEMPDEAFHGGEDAAAELQQGLSQPNPREASNRQWLLNGLGERAPDSIPEEWGRTAGAKFTPMEQREFIDEQGEARNKDKLNLSGTHYTEPNEDDGDEALFW